MGCERRSFRLLDFEAGEVMLMKILKTVLLLVMVAALQGCFLTKVVTVPMRLGGAVISIVPVVGNPVHDTIDEAAEVVDDIPL